MRLLKNLENHLPEKKNIPLRSDLAKIADQQVDPLLVEMPENLVAAHETVVERAVSETKKEIHRPLLVVTVETNRQTHTILNLEKIKKPPSQQRRKGLHLLMNQTELSELKKNKDSKNLSREESPASSNKRETVTRKDKAK